MNRWELGILLAMLFVGLNVHPAYGMATRAWGNENEPPFWSELFADASPVACTDQNLETGAGVALPLLRWGEVQAVPTQKPCNSLDGLLLSDTTEDIQAGLGVSTTLQHIADTLKAQVAIPEAIRLGLGLAYDTQDDSAKVKGLFYAGWDF